MILSDNSSSMASLKPYKKRTKGSRNATVNNEQMRWKWNKNQLTREKTHKIRIAIAAWTTQLMHHLKKDQTKTSSWWNSEDSTGTETSSEHQKAEEHGCQLQSEFGEVHHGPSKPKNQSKTNNQLNCTTIRRTVNLKQAHFGQRNI